MSGGHFEPDPAFSMEEAAREIQQIMATNGREIFPPELEGYPTQPQYAFPPDIIEKFKNTVVALRCTAAMLRRVDYLLCGDDGEESFRQRWKEEVEDGDWTWDGEGI